MSIWSDLIIKALSPDKPVSLDLKGISYNTENVDWYARNGYPQLHAMHGGGEPSYSGKSVTHETALGHSVVWACARILSETIGGLPLHLYQRLEGDGKERANRHQVYKLIHDAPNDEASAFEWREIMTLHCSLWGNAYARISRQPSGRIAGLANPWHPGAVMPKRGDRGGIVYDVRQEDGTEKTYPASEVFHLRGLGFDGLRGYSVVSMAANSIGNAMAAEEYTGKFYSKGGRVPYILKHPSKFRTDQDFETFRKKWEELYNEPHQAPILENGLEYQQIGLKPEDSQFLETRKFNVGEVCRWWLMKNHLVNDLDKATFSNIEHQSIEATQYTFLPWCNRWESAIFRCLLGRNEKGVYFAEHNLDGIKRGDQESRSKYYQAMRTSGVMTGNEIRAKENMNPIEGGDELLVQGAMIPVDQAGQQQGGNNGNQNV